MCFAFQAKTTDFPPRTFPKIWGDVRSRLCLAKLHLESCMMGPSSGPDLMRVVIMISNKLVIQENIQIGVFSISVIFPIKSLDTIE